MRLVDYLENRTREIVHRMNELQMDGYDTDDVGAAARDAAVLWERILKASESKWSAQRSSLHAISEELEQRGWGHKQALDTIRRAANADKHESSPSLEFDTVFNAMKMLADTAGALPHYVPHVVELAPERLRRRRMVCAIYDYFTQGETEYSFLAAGPNDTRQTVREIDSFQIRSQHSDDVESALATLDGWTFNPPSFNDLHASLRESDNEFWRLATFTASYQDVLDLMAPYQHNLPLIRGLHREDNLHNVVATIVADLIAERSGPVLTECSSEHDELRARVAKLLKKIPDSLTRLQLDRCNADVFAQMASQALAADRELGLLVKRNGVVLVLT